jgi:LPS-assembly protein
MRLRIFLFIMAFLPCHLYVWPQALTRQLPPADQSPSASPSDNPSEPANSAEASPPDDSELPEAAEYPIAEVLPTPPTGVPVRLEYEHMEKHGTVYTLTGAVKINYERYTLLADKVVYDQSTGDANAEGHVSLDGGPDDEFITADRGTVNMNADTARFENVVGSFGGKASNSTRKLVYATSNPFIFTGRVVIKKAPFQYRVIGGTMTSCELPEPDWRILAADINVDNGQARARNGFFKLLGVPVLYLPYVTHPVNTDSRESGLLIPAIGNSSVKGLVLGEAIYWAMNRSTDATFGTEYFSKRGWSPNGEIRYHGAGEDFATFNFIALFDRGAPVTHLNQGGQDILFNGRHDFDPDSHMRAVVSGEYLSSYVYREAFAPSYALAVASEVTSSAFVTHNGNGLSESIDFNRYQNFQGITQLATSYSTPQIEVLHVPSVDFDTVDRPLEGTPLRWGFDGSVAVLNRSEPGYNSGMAGRFDFNPHLALPFHLDGWSFRPEVGARETFYTQSQTPTNSTPIQDPSSVNRRDLEASFELRPPVLVRDFRFPWLERFLGSDVRHTLEPEIKYQYVAGIDNFSSIPRFDAVDVLSDTNEVAYSLTQRLFLKHLHPKPCTNSDLPKALNGIVFVPATYRECGGDTDAWITWTLAAKYFFDPTFGGAVSPFRRNVLTTTLDLTGVTFLGGPRRYSPIVSRFKVRTSQRMDIEWDADYDTKVGRLNASNLFADYRLGSAFASLGYATLQALNPTFTSAPASQVTKYNVLRLLGGYGSPTKPGLSVVGDAGYDFTENALQYYGIQATYNLNCCGLTLGYRRLALGQVGNESEPIFSLTLAGVGSAGKSTTTLERTYQIF